MQGHQVRKASLKKIPWSASTKQKLKTTKDNMPEDRKVSVHKNIAEMAG